MKESVESIPSDQGAKKKSWRLLALVIAIVTGSLAFTGSLLFLWVGAGMYGSPLAGDTWFNTTLFLVVLLGPMAILPCALAELRWPTWGGITLCNLAIPVVIFLILNNMRQWGFAIHDAAIGTVCLAVPMFAVGTLLWHSHPIHEKWAKIVWWIQLMILGGFVIYFIAIIGADEIQLFQEPQPAETYVD